MKGEGGDLALFYSKIFFFRPLGTDAQIRSVRKPASLPDTGALSYREFRDEDGQLQPIYKYYKKYPHGYSG